MKICANWRAVFPTGSFEALLLPNLMIMLIITLVNSGYGQAQKYNIEGLIAGDVPAYTIRQGHPRLLITSDNKELIIRRITQSDLGQLTFQSVIDGAEGAMSTDFSAIEDGSPSKVYDKFRPIEYFGIIHQLGVVPGFHYGYANERYGQKGVEALVAFASLEEAPKGDGDHNDRNSILALGYDWLYDLLTPAQREKVVNRLITTTSTVGEGLNTPGGFQMINPLAFYGDGIKQDVAKVMVDTILTRNWWGHSGSLSRLQVLQSGGVTSEEMRYAGSYSNYPTVLAAWYTATGQDFFQAGTFWPNFAKWMLHDFYPHADNDEGSYYFALMEPMHDTTVLNDRYYKYLLAAATAYLGRMGEEAYADAAAWAVRLPKLGAYNDLFFYTVLLGDPLRTPRSPKEAGIPPSHIIPGPLARVYMQSHWDDFDATWAMHGVSEWSCLRGASAIMNTVQIWKNGGLLLTHKQGYRHAYGPDFRFNIVRPYKPGDYADDVEHDKGMPGCDIRDTDVTQYTAKGGFLRAAKIVPGKYGYSAGDASAYLANGTDNAIRSSDRQFVWFPAPSPDGSDYFLIFDRVATDGETVQPHLVFNTVEEPRVSRDFGTAIAGESRVAGHWIVKNAPSVTFTNTQTYEGGQPAAHGRMFFKALLPRDVVIHRLGGLSSAHTYNCGSKGPVDLTYGIDVNDELTKETCNQLDGTGTSGDLGALFGIWRFHVVNQKLESNNTYLMAMEATDANQPKPSGDMKLVEGQGLVGARLVDAVGLFNPNYAPISKGAVAMPEGTEGNYRLLITDLYPSTTYDISIGNNQQTVISSDAGTIFLENVPLKTGDLLLVNLTGNPPTLTVVSTTLPDAQLGESYFKTLQAASGTKPYQWSVVSGSLPGGLVLSGENITGVPTALGTFNFTVQVKDATGNIATQALSIQVKSTPPDDDDSEAVHQFELKQNYPNPFNPETTIRYSIADMSQVKLKIYTALGQLVRTLVNDLKPAGEYQVIWNGKSDQGRSLTSGIYYYQMVAGEHVFTAKMVMLR